MDGGKAAPKHDFGNQDSLQKTYLKPVLRVYGSCSVLTATISGTSANRDQAGGGNVKTH